MVRVRRFLILLHRYSGIALSALFVVWFLSGIGMIYGRGMPRLTPELRLERLAPIDTTKVRWSAAEASAQAEGERFSSRVVLLMVMNRPAYRLATRTVFADTGEFLKSITPEDAATIAAEFLKISRNKLRVSWQTTVDQWTLSQRRQLPLHRVDVDDEAGTTLYISPQTAEVVVLTTRTSRALAWVSAIPHWLYFTSLRANDAAWRQVILWTSGVGCILALAGIALGFTQFRYVWPLRFPYAGAMRWHFVTGIVFGILTFTWVFSGLLSMEPWDWASSRGSGDELRSVLNGGKLNLNTFPSLDWSALQKASGTADLKEVEFTRLQGEPNYILRTSTGARSIVSAATMQPRTDSFTVDSLVTRIRQAYPGVSIGETVLLNDYDSYYYATLDREVPLPVLRVKLEDADKTWLYVDPAMSQLVRSIHWKGRIERWIYHGFHSLDFSFLYYKRPGWDVAMILLNIGGALTSGIGLFIGFGRVVRGLKRMSGDRVKVDMANSFGNHFR